MPCEALEEAREELEVGVDLRVGVEVLEEFLGAAGEDLAAGIYTVVFIQDERIISRRKLIKSKL